MYAYIHDIRRTSEKYELSSLLFELSILFAVSKMRTNALEMLEYGLDVELNKQ